MRHLGWFCLAAAAQLAIASPVEADVFKLNGGGEVRGELVNPDESPRTQYVIRPFTGGEMKLDASQVSEVVRQRPAEVDYEKLRLKAGDTVDDQWKLAEWCRQRNLNAERKATLEKILTLDPDHTEARRILGYEKVGDRWLTRDQIMQEKGYVKYHGIWRLPQDIEVAKQRKQDEQTRKEWFTKLKQWRMWLDGDKSAAGRQNILAITDKAADVPLITRMKNEKDYRVRELYAQALSGLGTPAGVKAIVQQTLEDPNENFRLSCLDLIEKTKPAGALDPYCKALKSPDNAVVNRAAMGLARLGNPLALGPLIDALVTQHKFTINTGQPGQISTSFSRDPSGHGSSGLGMGGGPKVIYRNLSNPEVLKALNKLTGQDFDYNVDAWKYWLASTRKKNAPQANIRRD